MQTESVADAAAAIEHGATLVDITTDPTSGRSVIEVRGVPEGFEERLRAGAIRVEPMTFSRLAGELFSMIRARARAGRRGRRDPESIHAPLEVFVNHLRATGDEDGARAVEARIR